MCFTIAFNGYETEYADCIDSQRAYCARHGYRFLAITSTPWRLSPRQSAWLKVEVLRMLLLSRKQHVAFIDADCEIRPHAPPFEAAIAPEASLMLAPGKSGRLNSGVIFARADEIAPAFLTKLISLSDVPVATENATAFENGHFIHYGGDAPFIGRLDHDLWNNNSHFDPESYIQHYSNGVMRRYREKVTAGRPKAKAPWARQILGKASVRLKRDTSKMPTPEFLAMAGQWLSKRLEIDA